MKISFVHPLLLLCRLLVYTCVYWIENALLLFLQHLVHGVDFKIKSVCQIAQLRRKAYCVVVRGQRAQLWQQWLLGPLEREKWSTREVDGAAISAHGTLAAESGEFCLPSPGKNNPEQLEKEKRFLSGSHEDRKLMSTKLFSSPANCGCYSPLLKWINTSPWRFHKVRSRFDSLPLQPLCCENFENMQYLTT